MILDERQHPKLAEGAYGAIFCVDNKLYKLFFSRDEAARGRRKRTFDSQKLAYEVCQTDSLLRSHVPKFYGHCEIADVIDVRGNSVKDSYLLDCCYVLERLEGEEEKFNRSDLGQRHPHLLVVADRFDWHRIRLYDSSVFNPADPINFKFIDFGQPESLVTMCRG